MDSYHKELHDSKIDVTDCSEHAHTRSPPQEVQDLEAPAVSTQSPNEQDPSQQLQNTPSPTREQIPYTAQETADAFDQAEQGIDPENASDTDDLGYETESVADSVSLASSARNFIYENGRRYHSFRAGSYLFPNDDREQDREDLKHAMYLLLFNKILHFAPLEDRSMEIIDLGTGTGIWAIDCS